MSNLRGLLLTAFAGALLAYGSRGYPLGPALVPVLSLLLGVAVGAIGTIVCTFSQSTGHRGGTSDLGSARFH